MSREIKNIVIHCTATSQNAQVSSIVKYWRNVLGWKSPGYHLLIDKFGNIHQLQHFDKMANGVRGHNTDSIHVSYIGGVEDGVPRDNRTEAQKKSMAKAIIYLLQKYPGAELKGHRDFEGVKKACPSFSVKEYYSKLKTI